MSKLTTILAAGALMGATSSAIASDDTVSAFAGENTPIQIAQAHAIDAYMQWYMQRMDESTMAMLDMNGDGMVSEDEFENFHDRLFDSMDRNDDDMLDTSEMMEIQATS